MLRDKVPAELIEQARNGDQESLNQLLVLSQSDMGRFARTVCATSEDAEDAVQTVLWKMSGAIGALKSVGAFTVWLFKIIKHECLKLLRARSKFAFTESSYELIPDTRSEPFEDFFRGFGQGRIVASTR